MFSRVRSLVVVSACLASLAVPSIAQAGGCHPRRYGYGHYSSHGHHSHGSNLGWGILAGVVGATIIDGVINSRREVYVYDAPPPPRRDAYNAGYDDGYRRGYSQGTESSYRQGQNRGYWDGFEDARSPR